MAKEEVKIKPYQRLVAPLKHPKSMPFPQKSWMNESECMLELKKFWKQKGSKENAISTQCSQAVTHPSTITAQCCLTSVIRRELVFSTWYGHRQRTVLQYFVLTNPNCVWYSGLSSDLKKEYRNKLYEWYTPLVEVIQAINAWSIWKTDHPKGDTVHIR